MPVKTLGLEAVLRNLATYFMSKGIANISTRQCK